MTERGRIAIYSQRSCKCPQSGTLTHGPRTRELNQLGIVECVGALRASEKPQTLEQRPGAHARIDSKHLKIRYSIRPTRQTWSAANRVPFSSTLTHEARSRRLVARTPRSATAHTTDFLSGLGFLRAGVRLSRANQLKRSWWRPARRQSAACLLFLETPAGRTAPGGQHLGCSLQQRNATANSSRSNGRSCSALGRRESDPRCRFRCGRAPSKHHRAKHHPKHTRGRGSERHLRVARLVTLLAPPPHQPPCLAHERQQIDSALAPTFPL